MRELRNQYEPASKLPPVEGAMSVVRISRYEAVPLEPLGARRAKDAVKLEPSAPVPPLATPIAVPFQVPVAMVPRVVMLV